MHRQRKAITRTDPARSRARTRNLSSESAQRLTRPGRRPNAGEGGVAGGAGVAGAGRSLIVSLGGGASAGRGSAGRGGSTGLIGSGSNMLCFGSGSKEGASSPAGSNTGARSSSAGSKRGAGVGGGHEKRSPLGPSGRPTSSQSSSSCAGGSGSSSMGLGSSTISGRGTLDRKDDEDIGAGVRRRGRAASGSGRRGSADPFSSVVPSEPRSDSPET